MPWPASALGPWVEQGRHGCRGPSPASRCRGPSPQAAAPTWRKWSTSCRHTTSGWWCRISLRPAGEGAAAGASGEMHAHGRRQAQRRSQLDAPPPPLQPAHPPEDEAGAPAPLQRKARHRGVQLRRVLVRQAVGQEVVAHHADAPGRRGGRAASAIAAGQAARRRRRVHRLAVVQRQGGAGRVLDVVREATVRAEAAVAAQVVDAGRGSGGGAAAARRVSASRAGRLVF